MVIRTAAACPTAPTRSGADDDRHNPLNIRGVIFLTHRSADQAVDQHAQLDQISEPKQAPPGRQHDERVRFGDVGPAHRQRELRALLVEEEHPIVRPRLPDRQEHELPTEPRMKGVRYPNGTLLTNGIGRS